VALKAFQLGRFGMQQKAGLEGMVSILTLRGGKAPWEFMRCHRWRRDCASTPLP